MIEIIRSETFSNWLEDLRDRRTRQKIITRIFRLAGGNPGDVKPVGEGISEMRIDHGPGYRVYYMQRGQVLAIILCGGDKSRQAADIERAKSLARDWGI